MKTETEKALDRGWQLIPLNGKTPITKKWQLGAANEDERTKNALAARAHTGNIGLVCGKPSGVVIIDIDTHSGAILTEDDFPTTWTVITGKGGKHLIYARPDIDFIGNKAKGIFDGGHVDIRGDGGQVVLVGGVHPETKKKYTWMDGRSPDDIPLEKFPSSILEKIKAKTQAPVVKHRQHTQCVPAHGTNPWVAAMLKNTTEKLASCRANRNDALNDTAVILGHYCPEYLSKNEIEDALTDAMRCNGYIESDGMYAVKATIESGLSCGMREQKHPPESNRTKNTQVAVSSMVSRGVVLKNSEPITLASHFLDTCDSRSLAYWMDSFWEYSQGAYQKIKDKAVDVKIRNGLEGVLVPFFNKKEEVWEDRKLVVKNTVVSEVFGAVKALDGVYLNENCDAPMWRDGRKDNPRDIFTCRNGLLNMKTGEFSPHDSSFFNLGASDFDFDRDAKCPQWEEWLKGVFVKDPKQILLLQEWFGYCLTYDCSQRKVMLLLGITTSGKGTILNILSSLLGRKNMVACEPVDTTDRWFGATVFGKRLVNFFDLRMGGRLDTAAFGSVILKLSEGAPTKIENKGKDIFTAPTVAKVTIASNNLPRFIDASSAVAGRFLTLRFTESFLGREDKTLDKRLADELPGIFIWAMAGLERLRDNGWRWTAHKAGEDTSAQMADECSPVRRFVEEECVLREGESIEKKALFKVWQAYCKDCNIQAVGTDSIFATQLHDAFPQLQTGKPKVDGRSLPRTHIGIRVKYEWEK